MISMGKSTIVGATCRSCRSVTPLLSGSRAKPTAVTRASTDTKQRSSAVNALADSNSNPWAQPGYLGAVVSQMPEEQQRTVFVGILAAISAGTVVSCSVLGPVISAYLPSFLQVHSNSWFPLGPIFLAAGVAHFTEEQGFKNMYPHQGAWGFWYLPGSDKFHVQWTGVAEILGGLGMCVGALPFDFIPSWISPASAYGLFLLTAVVTPSNIYMYTHNAPGPVPESVAPGALPWQGHLARGFMQVLLLSTLWGIATASS